MSLNEAVNVFLAQVRGSGLNHHVPWIECWEHLLDELRVFKVRLVAFQAEQGFRLKSLELLSQTGKIVEDITRKDAKIGILELRSRPHVSEPDVTGTTRQKDSSKVVLGKEKVTKDETDLVDVERVFEIPSFEKMKEAGRRSSGVDKKISSKPGQYENELFAYERGVEQATNRYVSVSSNSPSVARTMENWWRAEADLDSGCGIVSRVGHVETDIYGKEKVVDSGFVSAFSFSGFQREWLGEACGEYSGEFLNYTLRSSIFVDSKSYVYKTSVDGFEVVIPSLLEEIPTRSDNPADFTMDDFAMLAGLNSFSDVSVGLDSKSLLSDFYGDVAAVDLKMAYMEGLKIARNLSLKE